MWKACGKIAGNEKFFGVKLIFSGKGKHASHYFPNHQKWTNSFFGILYFIKQHQTETVLAKAKYFIGWQ